MMDTALNITPHEVAAAVRCHPSLVRYIAATVGPEPADTMTTSRFAMCAITGYLAAELKQPELAVLELLREARAYDALVAAGVDVDATPFSDLTMLVLRASNPFVDEASDDGALLGFSNQVHAVTVPFGRSIAISDERLHRVYAATHVHVGRLVENASRRLPIRARVV